MDSLDNSLIFIVGSPRSGTTILGEILDLHPDIRQWYEPYFIWDRYFRLAPDDERTENDATPEVIRYIRKNFFRFRKKSGCTFVVDKSPRNSLKIPFIKKIFPQARFIHIIRDGRDVTLSINKEWNRRIQIVEGGDVHPKFDYTQAFEVIKKWLSRQPVMLHRLRALWFETHGHILDKNKHTNRLRWNGKIGWGPRFKEWEKILSSHSLLQFNAHQWDKCVRSTFFALDNVETSKIFTLKYENFVQHVDKTLENILDFVGAKNDSDFYSQVPAIKTQNFNKWKSVFSDKEIEEIKPILFPMLDELGYLEKWPW